MSEIIVPIISPSERVVGVIAAESERLSAFSAEDREDATEEFQGYLSNHRSYEVWRETPIKEALRRIANCWKDGLKKSRVGRRR